MPPRPRVTSSGSNSNVNQTTSPRPPESQIEILYNTAVQSFVRRDHIKTQAILSRLLSLLKQKQNNNRKNLVIWYDSENDNTDSNDYGDNEKEDIDEWIIKTLKLSISSLASLYADPPLPTSTTNSHLPTEISDLLPPNNPNKLLEHLQRLCQDSYISTSSSSTSTISPNLLPPQLISTLLLASLKLRPSSISLDFAHKLSEDWFTNLPDEFILSISNQSQSTSLKVKDARKKKKLESAREGYLKVVELFVGEVLSREGEFEMARGFLDGENVMGSKRKEALFKHLRTIQSTPSNQSIPTQSPSSSLILPSDSASASSSTMSDSRTISRNSRSRSGSESSNSSSSSELTARPTGVQVQNQLGFESRSQKSTVPDRGTMKNDRKDKSKARIVSDEAEKGLNGSLHTNHSHKSRQNPSSSYFSSSSRSITPSSSNSRIQQIIRSILPNSIAKRLPILFGDNLSYFLSIPLPIIIILTFLIRRKLRRNPRRPNTPGISPMTSSSTINSIDDVKNKLRLVRLQRNNWSEWFVYYFKWWLSKFVGIWNLGTTITYV
ncbi:uncharacterized protein L201_004540 [Kwoniella dendrophila CBS 6074]|uniref:Letm1 RBD domain-containing protein n=1 Tax=Kwoniella dendrophila CBS 6074 TaxID=1295534 RepID=A0AAX4JYG2_9TREE